MKTKLHSFFIALALLAGVHQTFAQGTGFTYQGQLQNNGAPANGSYDLQFTLFNTNQIGFPVAPVLTNAAVPVNNGLFMTTLDFGSGIFTGTNFWIEISVRTNGSGTFTTLTPRQPIMPAPYAITAESLSGVAQNDIVSGDNATVSGGLYNQATANSATVGGGYGNYSTAVGATVAGGELNTSSEVNATVGGGIGNSGTGYSATIGGGYYNVSSGDYATVAGGNQGVASGREAAVVGGERNYALGDDSAVGGGYQNTIQSNAYSSTIGGGSENIIQTNANSSTIGGGQNNTIQDYGSFIGGGGFNLIQSNSDASTISGGYGNIIQINSVYSTISGGYGNTIQTNSNQSVIGGGGFNSVQVNSGYSTIGGGNHNNIQSGGAFGSIGGGFGNTIETNAYASSIAGGSGNTIGVNASSSFIAGGEDNTAAGYDSFAAGTVAQANHYGAFVWSDDSSSSPFPSTAANQFSVRAAGGVRFVTSGAGMTVDGNVGIGTSSPQTPLHLLGTDGTQLRLQNSVNSKYWNIYAESFNNSGNLVFTPGLGTGGYINQGDGNYYSLSDRRLKQDITPLDGVLDRVLQLRPVSYHFRTASEGTPPTLGLIAQEVEPLFPEVVGEHAGMKSLAYSELVPVTIRAVQELNQKVDSESAELHEELKHRDYENAELKQRLEALEKIILKQKSN